jgi:iron complex outermembrane recepter protein
VNESGNPIPEIFVEPSPNRRLRPKILLAAAACPALLLPLGQAAAAQSVPPPSASPSSATSDAPVLGDIVVTAQRDPALASKTPIAISAIGGDALRSAGVTNPLMLSNEVPNLELNRFYGLQITIRGVTNSDTTAKGDPSAAFLLDGVYIARPQAQEVSFFDIDRVEALRGPQGTLYGRNTTAGLINVISRRPTDKFEASANIGYGNYNTLQADAAINLPLSDHAALRIAGSFDRRDTYIIKDATDPYNDNPFKDNKSVRVSGKVDLGPNATLLVIADYSSMRGITQFNVDGSNFYVPVNGDPSNRVYVPGASASDRRGFDQGMTPYVNDTTWGVMGELNWNLGPVTATYLGSYRKLDIHEDTTDLLGMVTPTFTTQNYEQNSHEFRLALNDIARLKFQVGAMYFSERSFQYYDQPNYFGFDHFILDYGPTKSKSYAFFSQATYALADRFRVTAGVRYTHDIKSQVGDTILKSALFGDTRLVGGANVAFSKATWRVAADFDVTPRDMLYGSISTGYKSGGFNDGCLESTVVHGVVCNSPRSPSQLFYNPETLTSYEIGWKGRTSDNSVRYALTGFYYDYKNLQLSGVTYYNGAASQLIQNAAKATVKGVEAEVTLHPSARNRVDVQATWLDAHYRSYLPLGAGGPDFAGLPLDRSPKTSVTAGYTYTLPIPGSGSLELGVRSKLSAAYVISSFATAVQYRQPSYTRTELTATYNAPGGRWYVQGYVRNLENEVLITALTDVAGVLAIVPSDPRTYGVRAGFKF